MAFDRAQVYLTFGGTIGGTDGDVWQCGLHLAAVTPLLVVTQPTTGELQDVYDGAITDMVTAPDSYIASGASLTWAKAAHLDTGGDYTSDETYYEGSSATGASSVTGSAPQVSVAVTLFSGSAFGTANYGRYYLPWSTAPLVMATGTMSTTERDGMTARQKAFLDAVNDWAAALPTALRVSNMSSIGTGTTKPVAQVRVGSVKDTQRRRRNRLTESYSTLSLAV